MEHCVLFIGEEMLLPSHLPSYLTVGHWMFAYLYRSTMQLEDDVAGVVERGCNCIRLDACLAASFTTDGTPRPPVALYTDITSDHTVTIPALDHLLTVLRLCAKHNIYVILSSWDYMFAVNLFTDQSIRKSLLDIPLTERMSFLAKQHDRVLQRIKAEQLADRIAYVELHNEIDLVATRPYAKDDVAVSNAGIIIDGNRRYHEEAIQWLRDKHPDLRFGISIHNQTTEMIPRNIQVISQHVYTGHHLYDVVLAKTVNSPTFDPENSLRGIEHWMQPNTIPFEQFKERLSYYPDYWQKFHWFYHFVNPAVMDRELAATYRPLSQDHIVRMRDKLNTAAIQARVIGVPVVITEAGLWWPPLKSQFEMSQDVYPYMSEMCCLAAEHKFWGYMVNTCTSHPTSGCWPMKTQSKYFNDLFETLKDQQ